MIHTKAKIIKDSINPISRLTTFVCRFPRFILAEINTHKSIAKNTASSRAIPALKLVDRIRNDEEVFVPTEWAANQRGMQAAEKVKPNTAILVDKVWRKAALQAADNAAYLAAAEIHKQWTNRLMEPFLYVEMVMTSDNWDNFFSLRMSDFAQPELHYLAGLMLREYIRSWPVELEFDDWHIPMNPHTGDLERDIMISSGRIATVSYDNLSKKCTIDEDYARGEMLKNNRHFSPFEHICQSTRMQGVKSTGQFNGWYQYRKMLPQENMKLTSEQRFSMLEKWSDKFYDILS